MGPMASEKLAWFAAAAGTTGVLYMLYQHVNRPRIRPFSLQKRRDTAEVKQAFVLAVSLRFANILQKQHFMSIWQPLAEYVKAAEHVTLAFELLEADNDPCVVMVYERYISREAYEGTHRTSEPFKRFKTAMADLPFHAELSGQSYIESNIGFML